MDNEAIKSLREKIEKEIDFLNRMISRYEKELEIAKREYELLKKLE